MAALAPAAPEPTAADILVAAGRGRRGAVTAPELRRMQISEFAAWLRSRTNRHKRRFRKPPSLPTPMRPAPWTGG
jgi:hypothetical protein